MVEVVRAFFWAIKGLLASTVHYMSLGWLFWLSCVSSSASVAKFLINDDSRLPCLGMLLGLWW